MPAAVHSQHLQVAVGVTERGDWPAANEPVDADRLAGVVVDEVDLGELQERGLAIGRNLEFDDAEAPTTCSGGMP